MTTFVPTTEIPVDGARTLPREYFTSDALFAEEQERIFRRGWLCVGRAAEIAAPGAYLVREIAGTESVVVLRDRAGEVRAYHNVCRHRGTRLCQDHRGTLGGTIQCPYHAWTWSLDGRLVGAPSSEAIDGFDRADYPLLAVASAVWEGFLFVNLADDPEPFASAFAPLTGRLDRFNLASLVPARRIDYDVKANWKLVVQNYSECYHCSPVHPALVKLSPPTSGENDLIEGPILGGFMEIVGERGSLTMSGRACGVPVGELPAEDHARVYYYSIFPNMLLSLHPDYVMFHTLWPQSPGRTVVECTWLFHPESLDHPAFDPNDGVEFWDMTNRQDWHVCELSQLGVRSHAYRPGPYSRRESLSVAFDREVLRALGRGR